MSADLAVVESQDLLIVYLRNHGFYLQEFAKSRAYRRETRFR